MAVFRDKKVPIPSVNGITINRGDKNRVLYVLHAPYDRNLKYTKPVRSTIGYVCSDDVKLMYPTDKYKLFFPNEWEKLFSEKSEPVIRKIGMYSLFQAANLHCGIKDVMDEVFTKPVSNRLADFAMYSILFHSDSACQFQTRMSDQILYSSGPYSDSAYSELFEKRISRDDVESFRKAWARNCREDGVENVWLCIDGSNDNCTSSGVELAEKGHAKSHENIDIVSYTYAVSQEGRPVTFDVYRGGLVDAKAMERIVMFLSECGMSIKGVILDRGYCDSNVMKYLDDRGIAYCIMIKGNPKGIRRVYDQYGQRIKMNTDFLIESTYLFGVQSRTQLFEERKKEDHITLFYDYRNASDRISALLKKLYREEKAIRTLIQAGKEASVSSSLKALLTISGEGADRKVEINRVKLQEEIDAKGLYGIVTSFEDTPQNVHSLYSSRMSSEIQYRTVKSQLGYGTVRVHMTQGVYTRFMAGFIASIVRHEVEAASKKIDRTATDMVSEMNLMEIIRINKAYVYVHTENDRQVRLLKNLGAEQSLFDDVVKDENNRIAGIEPIPRHRKPGPKPKEVSSVKKTGSENPQKVQKKKVKESPESEKKKRPDVNKDGQPRKKPGPKAGFKRSDVNKDGSPRQKPGPKTGSHRSKNA